MTEADAIEAVDEPGTVASLASDFRSLGIDAGDTLLVHSSLSSLGWVAGGPQAVVDALQEVLTPEGTLVMPTHSGQFTDPEGWENPPVPDDWIQPIRDEMPPFRPEVTPTRGMGAIAECFRTYPDVLRSEHPSLSFAAWGAGADEVVGGHELDYGLGENSPLARVYDRDGDVLLLGVGHDRNTSLHLAEYRADVEKEHTHSAAPLLRDGERVVVEYEDIEIDSDDFDALGADFESEVGLTEGTVGAATATYGSQPELVEFAVEWFESHR
ncbi:MULTISPECIES: aminoglycoside N(3)-acetyltransferase [Haloferax]|uniref:Aminoglycoside N(3)-acetyltransferase n=1 Tax=Haloferax marinum TaxID=2666143 RepID=A0A6A8G2X1_9EURY|nr:MULTISPECIES: AAC(3) family N-acetyltransferase [Haloferax]KAB1196454.1 AAC(3) family N-acetyltransferase [Haloferax sp. CBA1150]MRW95451.1 aminoglycoside N(3)-acetyltransferase [Haloferax marinum]